MADAGRWQPYSLRSKLVRYLIPDLDLALELAPDLKLRASLRSHLALFRGDVLKREAATAEAICKHIPAQGTVYDVGANIGLYTLVFARNRIRKVISVEPGERALRYLRENVRLNGLSNVDIQPLVLSDSVGTRRFTIDHVTTATSHVSAQGEDGIEYPCTDLDSLVDRLDIPPPNLIKLDVEGHEDAILRGMNRTLARYRPMVYLEGGLRDRDGQIPAMRFFEGAGYRNFDYAKERLLTPDTLEYAFLAVPISPPN